MGFLMQFWFLFILSPVEDSVEQNQCKKYNVFGCPSNCDEGCKKDKHALYGKCQVYKVFLLACYCFYCWMPTTWKCMLEYWLYAITNKILNFILSGLLRCGQAQRLTSSSMYFGVAGYLLCKEYSPRTTLIYSKSIL